MISYINPPDADAIEALREFAASSDRIAPLRFVGRQDLLEDVELQLRATRDKGKSISNGIFIQGAPGAGKTAFLEEIKGRYKEEESACAIWMGAGSLSNLARFIGYFYDPEEMRVKSTRKKLAFRLGWDNWQVGFDWESIEPSVVQRLQEGVDVWSIIKAVSGSRANHTFIVCIDEAQRVRRDKDSEENTLAVDMHDGDTGSMKVLPVFAGLGDTPQKLNDAGVSREAKDYVNLGALSYEEGVEASEALFDHADFKIRDSFSREDREQVCQAIAIACEGWPRHLHCYLRSFASAIVQDCDRARPTRRIDLDEVFDEGHALRVRYADRRVETADIEDFEGPLMAVAEGSVEQGEFLVDDLRAAALEQGIEREEFRDCLGKSIHCGILERAGSMNGVNLYRFPIPSFHTFMANRKDYARTLANMRRELEDKRNERAASTDASN